MRKFTFNNQTKTEIRHNIVPEFLIQVIRLDFPDDYVGAELTFADLFDEILIRGWHFVFKMEGGEFVYDEEEIRLYRSICRRAAKWYKAQVVAGLIPLEKFIYQAGTFEDENFKLQKSDKDNWWIIAHKESSFIIEFEAGRLNESQQVINFGGENIDMLNSAKIMREIGDWLVKHHANLI